MIRTHRPLIMGRNGAVGANHPMATQAGLDILRAGGNAFDAAAAISLALGVCEPMMSGLGGDGFYNIHLAATRKNLVYNGTGSAPAAATAERFKDGVAVTGPLSASIPGCLGAIGAMHAAHGRLPWAQLAGPAIALARDGYAATRKDRQIAVDPKVIGYLVPRMERSPAEAVALAELMDRLALARGTAVTRAIAAEALKRRREARGEEAVGLEWEADDE